MDLLILYTFELLLAAWQAGIVLNLKKLLAWSLILQITPLLRNWKLIY